VRKGLIPSVGALRRRGTSFILEDVVFPVPRLADGVTDLQRLFREHGYDDAIVFGHAKDGNLHFVLTQAFDRPEEVARYDRFMHALADLVVGRYDGALKAEHGTGRNMAPFVATEWGREAYELMRELKRTLDPDGLLNPGVILNDDPRAHVADLKELAAVEDEVDPCIECGFCERLCPSRDLTLTPRQRIVVRREMARLRRIDPGSPALAELEQDFRYAGLDTCATDGMCALACPVGIDTGSLVKRLRYEAHSDVREELASVLASRFDWLARGARIGLRLTRHWDRRAADLPPAAGGLPNTSRSGAVAIYFPSCVTRVLGSDREPGVAEQLVAVADRGGMPVSIPEDAQGVCCGMAFSSKGYRRAAAFCRERSLERMAEWTDGGRLPVVVDTSPCALTLKRVAAESPARRLEILDSVEFAGRLLAAGLRPRRRLRRITLHPTCSLHRSHLVGTLESVGRACAEETLLAADGCCGFAGDRGFLRPELTAAALRPLAAELAGEQLDGAYSTSRTCEIGLTRATGLPYRSLWSLLDDVTSESGSTNSGRPASETRKP